MRQINGLTTQCEQVFLPDVMHQRPVSRPVHLLRLLGHHPAVTWQLTIGLSALMLALSFYITGSSTGALILALTGSAALGWGIYNFVPLWKHDLPLLREGVPVLAKVVAPVSRDDKHSLFHISYRLPSDRSERNGVFMAPADASYESGEPLLVMVNRNDPQQLLEVTGQYEELMHPILEKEYAA